MFQNCMVVVENDFEGVIVMCQGILGEFGSPLGEGGGNGQDNGVILEIGGEKVCLVSDPNGGSFTDAKKPS